MKKFTKFLSLAMAALFAISVFTIDSNAMSSVAQSHVRQLTAEEIQLIYPMFHADQYANMYPDVVKELGSDEATLFSHFITFGIWEQRQPSVAFNVDVYASRNSDLQIAFGDDIIAYYTYYATHVKKEGFRPLPTVLDAFRNNCTIYSVYDFVKGQAGPKAGAIPVQNGTYYPGIESTPGWNAK